MLNIYKLCIQVSKFKTFINKKRLSSCLLSLKVNSFFNVYFYCFHKKRLKGLLTLFKVPPRLLRNLLDFVRLG